MAPGSTEPPTSRSEGASDAQPAPTGSFVGRIAARGRETRSRVERRLEQERERRYVVALGFIIADRSRQAAAAVLAGALAFRFFLVLLPLSLVSVVGLGYLKSAGGTPSDALKEFGIRGVIASTIDNSAKFTNPGRTAVLALGLIALVGGARTATATVRAIHALAWGIPVQRWKRNGRGALVFLGTVLVGFVLGGLATRARADAGVGLGFGASTVVACVVAVVWVAVSFLLPHREGVKWTAFIPGAALVGIGFAVLQAVTANWIGPKLQHASKLYGPLAVSFVILGWLYVVGRLMVAAPLLNVAFEELSQSRSKHRRSHGETTRS
jgi:uncharacterized BrkB/YihY/UPF0761 family membrane protein